MPAVIDHVFICTAIGEFFFKSFRPAWRSRRLVGRGSLLAGQVLSGRPTFESSILVSARF